MRDVCVQYKLLIIVAYMLTDDIVHCKPLKVSFQFFLKVKKMYLSWQGHWDDVDSILFGLQNENYVILVAKLCGEY